MRRNKNKQSRRIFLILPAILIAAVVSNSVLHGSHKEKQRLTAQPPIPKIATTPARTVFRGLPQRLKVESIAVDAPLEYLGLTKTGDVASPNNVSDAGWYKYGPLPGESGTTVIDGHVIGLQGQPGVFKNLSKLQVGDIVQVADAKENVASFAVRSSRLYGENEQPSEVFNSGPGTHLNLISCAGEWDAATRHYLKRLVVFTDLVSPQP